MNIGRLFAELTGLTRRDAALRLTEVGVPVFPCVPGAKRPLVPGGFQAATTNLSQVEAWWRRRPDANVAVPTGSASGIEVVDVDRHGESGLGLASFKRARDAGLLHGWAALVATPSGGLHVYYPTDPAREQRNWQAASAQIDFRGEGGYVLVPPSRVSYADGSSGVYALSAQSVAPTLPVDAVALRKFLVPPKPRRRFPASPFGNRRSGTSNGRRADWVAGLVEGKRNAGLFYMACRMVEDGFALPETLSVLGPAAEQAGLGPQEITRTVESAYQQTGPKQADSAASATRQASGCDTASRSAQPSGGLGR